MDNSWLEMERKEESVIYSYHVKGVEEGRTVLEPSCCLAEEEEFWLWKKSKDQERRAKIAEGKYEPECQIEEEGYLEWWGSYDWNQKEQVDAKKGGRRTRGKERNWALTVLARKRGVLERESSGSKERESALQ